MLSLSIHYHQRLAAVRSIEPLLAVSSLVIQSLEINEIRVSHLIKLCSTLTSELNTSGASSNLHHNIGSFMKPKFATITVLFSALELKVGLITAKLS